MSRVGNLPIPVPSGVSVKLSGSTVEVKGPKGQLSATLPEAIQVEVGAESVKFRRSDERRQTRALHGLARALTANLVTGVTEGFSKELEIQGVGYRASTSGNTLTLLLGYSHPVEMEIPKGISVEVDGGTRLKILGIDKQLVGQFAADVRGQRPPEPYKGKGVRYVDETVRRKVGKTGAA